MNDLRHAGVRTYQLRFQPCSFEETQLVGRSILLLRFQGLDHALQLTAASISKQVESLERRE
jgi:hypothetical protein